VARFLGWRPLKVMVGRIISVRIKVPASSAWWVNPSDDWYQHHDPKPSPMESLRQQLN